MEHQFEVIIEGLRGLKLFESMIWGEADCFVQFFFPTQQTDQGHERVVTAACECVCLSVCLSVCLPVCLPVIQPNCFPVYLHACLTVRLIACLFVLLHVCFTESISY